MASQIGGAAIYCDDSGFFICVFTGSFYNPSLCLWLTFGNIGFNLLPFIHVDERVWWAHPFL